MLLLRKVQRPMLHVCSLTLQVISVLAHARRKAIPEEADFSFRLSMLRAIQDSDKHCATRQQAG